MNSLCVCYVINIFQIIGVMVFLFLVPFSLFSRLFLGFGVCVRGVFSLLLSFT